MTRIFTGPGSIRALLLDALALLCGAAVVLGFTFIAWALTI